MDLILKLVTDGKPCSGEKDSKNLNLKPGSHFQPQGQDLNEKPVDITLRERIAHRMSLRPVRPHIPLYRLAAQRVQTLWALYRAFLRVSPKSSVRQVYPSIFLSFPHPC